MACIHNKFGDILKPSRDKGELEYHLLLLWLVCDPRKQKIPFFLEMMLLDFMSFQIYYLLF